MMGNVYYYFAASLPMIAWEGKLPMSTEEFRQTAQRLLEAGDYAVLERLLGEDGDSVETNNSVASSWIAFDRNFRNEIAWFRAHRAHKNAAEHIRGMRENEPALREVIHEASRTPNLLEAEKIIDMKRWQRLDELAAAHYYDFEFLLCYGLKLKILEKHNEYKSSKGREAFDTMKSMELPVEWEVSGI